jgi:ABC-2 type transport system permease protein
MLTAGANPAGVDLAKPASVADHWSRAFGAAARMGWLFESNWTDPFLFLIYIIVRPLASALILVVLYHVVTSGRDPLALRYLYLGNAYYIIVSQLLVGLIWTIVEDREFRGIIRYIYITPCPYLLYLWGRESVKLSLALVSTAVTLGFGAVVLGTPFLPAPSGLPVLLVAFALGIPGILGLALAIGGLGILTPRYALGIAEGVGGIFFFVSGALFPIQVLPEWVQGISRALPITYWFEAVRRAYGGGLADPALAAYSTATLFAILAASSALTTFLGALLYRSAEHLARRSGTLDATSGW